MLFNIKTDPHQIHDIKDDNPEICAKGAKIILNWQEEMMKTSDSDRDPMWTVYREGGPHHAHDKNLGAYIKRLENSDRAAGAQELRKRYSYKD
jgi:hypothetical protein